jgi:hypothetical protein
MFRTQTGKHVRPVHHEELCYQCLQSTHTRNPPTIWQNAPLEQHRTTKLKNVFIYFSLFIDDFSVTLHSVKPDEYMQHCGNAKFITILIQSCHWLQSWTHSVHWKLSCHFPLRSGLFISIRVVNVAPQTKLLRRLQKHNFIENLLAT